MNQKSSGTAYLLLALCVFGIAGINRFYVGKIGTGILFVLTFGLCGIGIIYDLFTIPKQVRLANALRNNGTIQNTNTNNNVQTVVVNVHTGDKENHKEELKDKE